MMATSIHTKPTSTANTPQGNRGIALGFAKMVCLRTGRPADAVPRSGCCSIFALLEQLLPDTTRTEGSWNYDGVSSLELNKMLQVAHAPRFPTMLQHVRTPFFPDIFDPVQTQGFRRVRDRRAGATNRSQDPLGAGLYVFSGVRFLNPCAPDDHSIIASRHLDLIKAFPYLAAELSLEDVLRSLHHARDVWEDSWRPSNPRLCVTSPAVTLGIRSVSPAHTTMSDYFSAAPPGPAFVSPSAGIATTRTPYQPSFDAPVSQPCHAASRPGAHLDLCLLGSQPSRAAPQYSGDAAAAPSSSLAASVHVVTHAGVSPPEGRLPSSWPVDEWLMLDLPAGSEEHGWAPLERMLPLALGQPRRPDAGVRSSLPRSQLVGRPASSCVGQSSWALHTRAVS
mmetsp:Transcript_60805/g.162617  ORF Transcript_60805/g.162617 Transcript_60805/m.162617 type:complete len:394 (+) Transcript_60805:133-1314(+)